MVSRSWEDISAYFQYQIQMINNDSDVNWSPFQTIFSALLIELQIWFYEFNEFQFY
jgi:hypothetical protein